MEDTTDGSSGIHSEKNQLVTANKSIKHDEYNRSSDEVTLENGSDYLEDFKDVIRNLADKIKNLEEKIKELEFEPQRFKNLVTDVQLSFPHPDEADVQKCININADKVEISEHVDTQTVKRQVKKYRKSPRYSNFIEVKCWYKYLTCNEEIEGSVISIGRIYKTLLQNQHDGCVQQLQTLKANVGHETQLTRLLINYYVENQKEKIGLFIRTNIIIYEYREQTKDLWTLRLFKMKTLFRLQYMKTLGRKVLKYTDGKSWLKEFFKRSNHILLKPCLAINKKVRALPEIKVFRSSTHSVKQKKNKAARVPGRELENTKELFRTGLIHSCFQNVTSLDSQIKCLRKYVRSYHKKECEDEDIKREHFQSIIELGPIPYQSISVLPVTLRVDENELVERPDGGILEQSVPNLPGQLGLFGVESRPELNDGSENVEAHVRTEHDIISIHGNNSSLSSSASNFVRRLTNHAMCSSTNEEINQVTEPKQNQDTVRKEIQNSNCQPVPCTGARADIQQSEQVSNSSCHSPRNAQNPHLRSMVGSANLSSNSVRITQSPVLGAVGGIDIEIRHFEESFISRENSILYGRIQEESQGRSTVLHNVRGRAQTFNAGWTLISPTPEQLAKAGFYYCGPNDRTRCICCGIQLERWEADDDPLVEHLKHSPGCSFANSKMENLQVSLIQAQNIAEFQFVENRYSGIQESGFTSIQETHYSTVTEGWQHGQCETFQDDIIGEISIYFTESGTLSYQSVLQEQIFANS